MKTHFSEDEYAEEGICGIYSEQISNHWYEATCKKCLKLRDIYESQVIVEEQYIVNQMGDFVEFCKREAETS